MLFYPTGTFEVRAKGMMAFKKQKAEGFSWKPMVLPPEALLRKQNSSMGEMGQAQDAPAKPLRLGWSPGLSSPALLMPHTRNDRAGAIWNEVKFFHTVQNSGIFPWEGWSQSQALPLARSIPITAVPSTSSCCNPFPFPSSDAKREKLRNLSQDEINTIMSSNPEEIKTKATSCGMEFVFPAPYGIWAVRHSSHPRDMDVLMLVIVSLTQYHPQPPQEVFKWLR